MPSPRIPQGTLNRAAAAVTFPNFQSLSISAPYLGADGISVNMDPVGEAIDTMTGVVTSPKLFTHVSLEIDLLKTNGFAQQWMTQIQSVTSVLENALVHFDTPALEPLELFGVIVRVIDFGKTNGTNPTAKLSISGSAYVNQSLWEG